MTPHRLGIVADDLTGAADSAVPFAEHGWPAYLLLHPSARFASGPGVLAVATGVRALTDDLAAERTEAAVRELAELGCDRIYVKVDSTMRGSVAGQLRGALAAQPDAVAVLCPAFATQQRTVVDGRVLVSGVPLEQSAAAHDPVTPVHESLLTRLVPGSVRTTVEALAAGLPAVPSARSASPKAVFVTDAESEADLDMLAVVLDQLGPATLAAGSAGLATALARQWSPQPHRTASPVLSSRRILVAVSSLHPTALSAVTQLRAGEIPGTTVDIVTTPTDRSPDSGEVATIFATDVIQQLNQNDYDALVLVGGDGAAATLRQLEATAIALHGALRPGVPTGAVVGGPADGLRIVTSSGGFGDEHALADLVRRLRHPG